jgi:hypothetical protein
MRKHMATRQISKGGVDSAVEQLPICQRTTGAEQKAGFGLRTSRLVCSTFIRRGD